MSIAAASGPALEYTRGDTAALRVRITRKGQPVDLTGFTSIRLTVSNELNPTNSAGVQAVLNGALTATPTDGYILLTPPSQAESDAYVPAAGLFYDLEALDGDSARATLGKGPFTIAQDISK